MAERQDREAPSRRAFFRTLGVGAAAAASGVASGGAALGGTAAEAAAARPDGSLGYRETAHVKKVYETARF